MSRRQHSLIAALLLAAGCAGAAGAAAQAAAPTPPPAADGKALFMKNCAACHQASGRGIPGAFPALAGNAFVQGRAGEVAAVLLKGRGGMPDFSDSLSDRDIAAVLSFVRSNWGNAGAPLAEAEVLAQRDALQVDHYNNGQMSNKH
ncbi:cytochrome C [Janthinobacterium sp. BJB412]|nr:cytochrome C [Janthinobacterium sp. BJB412]